MLSRIAESLYWMGRYLERADDTARILDVHLHRTLAESIDDAGGVEALAAMGLDAGGADDGEADLDLWRSTEVLAYDIDNPSSVAGSLELARDNARGLRETLASEVWEAINRTHHELEGQVLAARSMGPHLFFRWVRDRVAQIGGLFDSIVLHDDGWRFFTIGRCLERVDMTSRLLGGVAGSTDPGHWAGVLISCGAYDAFLRTHGGDVTRSRALGLVLQSTDLPRSVVFALSEAESCLRQVARSDSTPDPAERVLGRMRSELVYAGADELTPTCEPVLDRLQDTCRRADELVRSRYFRRADLIEWHPEGRVVTVRLAITHRTAYRYDAPVTSSYNEARLEPRSDRRQTVLSWGLDVTPTPRVAQNVDYWGTIVHRFDLQVPHTELTVVANALVEVGSTRMGPGDATWDELESDEVRDRFHELLAPGDVVSWDGMAAEVAADIRGSARTPSEAAEAAVGWVHDHLQYERGFTGVMTTADEVLGSGHGVCQDFAHASLAVLRAMGIPSWYVSGYLHPHEEPEIGEQVQGEGHAWVAAWTGEVWPLDPTSLATVHQRHVRVAAGREYHDVAPFRGIYAGGGEGQTLDVAVEVTRRA